MTLRLGLWYLPVIIFITTHFYTEDVTKATKPKRRAQGALASLMPMKNETECVVSHNLDTIKKLTTSNFSLILHYTLKLYLALHDTFRT